MVRLVVQLLRLEAFSKTSTATKVGVTVGDRKFAACFSPVVDALSDSKDRNFLDDRVIYSTDVE